MYRPTRDLAILFLSLTGVVSLACQVAPPAATTLPQSRQSNWNQGPTADVDIPLQLRLSAESNAGGAWQLIARAESDYDPDVIASVEVSYEIPEGVRVLYGQRRWQGRLDAGARGREFPLVLDIARNGRHEVRCRVEVQFADGKRVTKTDGIFITRGPESLPAGLIETLPFKDGTGVRVYRGERIPGNRP